MTDRNFRPYRSILNANQAIAAVVIGLITRADRKSYDPIGEKPFTADELKLLDRGEIVPIVAMKAGTVANATFAASEAVCTSRGWKPDTKIGDQVAAVVILEQFEAGKKSNDSLPTFHEHVVGVGAYAKNVRVITLLKDKGNLVGFMDDPSNRFERVIGRLARNGETITEAKLFNEGGVDRKEFEAYAESLRSSAMALRAGFVKNPEYARYQV